MKKVKLLTSLAALALVLGLGACDQTNEDETTSGDEDVTSEDTGSIDTGSEEVSTEGAYALVGDFVDASWDAEPATDSKYFIAAGTTHYEVEVEIDPDLTWTAGLRVVEWGKDNWTLVAGYDQLDANSTGVIGEGSDNNIQVETGATYDIVLDFGETNSILVTLQENEGNEEDNYEVNEINKMITSVAADHNYNATSYYYLYQSDTYETPTSGVSLSVVQAFCCDVYATEDAIIFEYLQYATYDGQTGWYYMDIELFVNDYETGKVNYYILDYYANSIYEIDYVDSYDGTWEDLVDNLGDLAPYRSAFTVAQTGYDEAYGNIESYAVDVSALDAIIATTVGNNYIWDDLFTGGGGWGDQYFGYPDVVSAEDIFSCAESYDAYYYGAYGQVFDFTFDDGGAWYYTNQSHTSVIAQEIMAWTDVYGVGETEIPTGFESFL